MANRDHYKDIPIREIADLLLWAADELRDMDLTCRSHIPGFEPWKSEEIEKVNRIQEIGEVLSE